MAVEVLIIRLSAIGDVVHALPVACAIKKRIEGARITWVVEPAAAPLLVNNPVVDEVLIFPGKALLKLGTLFGANGGSLSELVRLVKKLRLRRFDCAIDLQGLFKSAFLTYLSGAPVRIGFKNTREFADTILTHPVDVGDYFGHDRHVVDLGLCLAEQLFAVLGKELVKPQVADFVLPKPPPEVLAKFADMIPTKSMVPPNVLSSTKDLLPPNIVSESSRLAVLIPCTTWESKIWPGNQWSKLGQLLIQLKGYRIILVGGLADLKINNAIAENIRSTTGAEAINLTGKTSLLDLIALFHTADLVVGADTGPLHIAAATGKPTVIGIYGSTPIKRNGPYGKQCHAIVLDLECQPCFAKICPLGTTACLKEMGAEYVFEQITEFV